MEWYISALKKYVDFSGRARRKEYWMFCLYNFCFATIIWVVSVCIHVYALNLLYWLATFLPGLAVSVRRLHDTGKSANWLAVSFIPYIGVLWLIILFCIEGQVGPNEFGPNPTLAS